MTDPDYNRRMATALGWRPPSARGRCDVCGWPLTEEGGRGCWPSNCSMRPTPEPRADAIADYATDWRELPAILAALDKFGGWRVKRILASTDKRKSRTDARYFIESNEVRLGECIFATGDTLLLAAGALLLRLTNRLKP